METVDVTQLTREELEEALVRTSSRLASANCCLELSQQRVKYLEAQIDGLSNPLMEARATALRLAKLLGGISDEPAGDS